MYYHYPIQDVHVFLSSVEKKLRFLMKTFQNFLQIMDFIGYQTVWFPLKSIVWRKILEILDNLDNMGVSKLSANVFLKVNHSFKGCCAAENHFKGCCAAENHDTSFFHI